MQEHLDVLAPRQPRDPESLQWQLHCPECRTDGIEREGPDHDAITVQPDRDDYSSPIGTRGATSRLILRVPSGTGSDWS